MAIHTIADGGGTDTIDASLQQRSSTIDHTPGSFSSIGLYTRAEQLADIGKPLAEPQQNQTLKVTLPHLMLWRIQETLFIPVKKTWQSLIIH